MSGTLPPRFSQLITGVSMVLSCCPLILSLEADVGRKEAFC